MPRRGGRDTDPPDGGAARHEDLITLSDEEVCARWEYDTYFQHFCGEVYFQHRFPIDRSSLSHGRKRLGESASTRPLRRRARNYSFTLAVSSEGSLKFCKVVMALPYSGSTGGHPAQ
jgi:hypothetical protein